MGGGKKKKSKSGSDEKQNPAEASSDSPKFVVDILSGVRIPIWQGLKTSRDVDAQDQSIAPTNPNYDLETQEVPSSRLAVLNIPRPADSEAQLAFKKILEVVEEHKLCNTSKSDHLDDAVALVQKQLMDNKWRTGIQKRLTQNPSKVVEAQLDEERKKMEENNNIKLDILKTDVKKEYEVKSKKIGDMVDRQRVSIENQAKYMDNMQESFKKKQANFESQIGKLEAENGKLKAEIGKSEAQFDKLGKIVENLQQRVAHQESNIENLKTENLDLKQENYELQQKFDLKIIELRKANQIVKKLLDD